MKTTVLDYSPNSHFHIKDKGRIALLLKKEKTDKNSALKKQNKRESIFKGHNPLFPD